MNLKLFYLSILHCSFSMLSAQTLALDPIFGNGGKILHSFDPFSDTSGQVVIQDDGKILVCGLNDFTISGNVYLARYNEDGSPDTGFGNNGIALTVLISESTGNHVMKLLPNGKILVASSKSVSNNAAFFNFAALRYNTDGTIDNTFGTNGLVETDIAGLGNFANGLAVQSDGKIIVAGYTYSNSNLDAKTTLVRYSTDGVIDSTFGTNGKIMLDLIAPNTYQHLWDIKVLADDSILIGVNTTAQETFPDSFSNIAILKVDSNGSPDMSFGTNGFVLTDFGGLDVLYAIDEYQGNIVMAGYSRYPGYRMILSKYLANGTPDNSFGVSGKVIANKDAASSNDGLFSMQVLGNGKILCSGWTGGENAMDAMLIQFNTDGSIDTGFNETGYVTTDIDNTDNTNYSFAMQPDGKIVCSGWAENNNYQDAVLMRYDVSALSATSFVAKNGFAIVPNPINDKTILSLNLNTSDTLSADLFDSNGRKIQSLFAEKPFPVGRNHVALSFPDLLPRGLYFLKITNGYSTATLKIVK